MKKYTVTESKRSNYHRHVTVEARDAQEAVNKFKAMEVAWDSENSGTEINVSETMGSAMLGGDVAYPTQPGATRAF